MTDDEARNRLLAVLDKAHTFAELCAAISAEHGAASGRGLFGCALRFLSEGDATVLDAGLQERFARVLSRFVESPRALQLAGVLESGEPEG